jgi:hypothetical protein
VHTEGAQGALRGAALPHPRCFGQQRR